MGPCNPGTIDRRSVLRMIAAGAAASWAPGRAWALGGPYRVGVGSVPDPYDATLRAIAASGEWPAVAGKRVYIKPNLLHGDPPESGVTTDPDVVRAVVDTALAAGAAQVSVVDSAPGAHFQGAGYGFFANYDPRVRVASMRNWPSTLAPVPGGRTYERLILPAEIVDPDIVFVSAAKLKTHVDGRVTLAMKNLFGIPPPEPYVDEEHPSDGRFGMHARSMAQTVVDLNLTRPVHFAVIDGIIGMEGRGPRTGDPVRMDVVLAGRNALAVDRVGVEVMRMDPGIVLQLLLATAASLGPAGLDEIVLAGDPLPTRAFARPAYTPMVVIASAPDVLVSGGGSSAPIRFGVDRRRPARVGIATVYDDVPWDFTHVALVRDWAWTDAGWHDVTWDGRDDAGAYVPPGRYAIRVRVDDPNQLRDSFAFRWIDVV